VAENQLGIYEIVKVFPKEDLFKEYLILKSLKKVTKRVPIPGFLCFKELLGVITASCGCVKDHLEGKIAPCNSFYDLELDAYQNLDFASENLQKSKFLKHSKLSIHQTLIILSLKILN